MSQPSASVQAKCETCGATYRAANSNRTYQCKACGGTVRAIAEHDDQQAEPVVVAGSVTCPSCQAIHPGGLHFCNECGASLPDSTPRPGSDAARRLREEAADALKRVSRGFQIVAWTYQCGAIAYAIATLFAVLSLAQPDVPVAGGVTVVALTTTLSVLFGMGALHTHFKPFVWTVAIAVVTTAVTAIHVAGPNPFGLAALGSAAWALVAYGLLVPTFWFRKQIAKHKDLYVLHHASKQTRQALRGRSAQDRHDRLMDALRRAALRTWVVSTVAACLFVVASSIGTWVHVAKRPTPFGPALERFEQAWNSGNIRSVGDVFEPGTRKLATDRLTGSARGHGWGRTLPRLGEGEVEATGGRATVAYQVADVPVSTHWTRIDNQWELDRIDIRVPVFQPTLDRFLAAWKGSDPEKIVEFFAPDARGEMLAELQSVIDERGWESMPPILDTQLTPDGDTYFDAVHELQHGKLTVRWSYRTEGYWRISRLKLPWR